MIYDAQKHHDALKNDKSYIQTTLLTVMLMTQYKFNIEDPFKRGEKYGEEEETRNFLKMQLLFLKETPFDCMSQWTEEELEFYNRISFPMKSEENRKLIFQHLSKEFTQNHKLSKKYPGLFNSGGYNDFLHWYDVAQTRTHSLYNV